MSPESFQQQVYKLTDPLYRFAYWRIGQKEEAEDAVQETFMRMWKMNYKLEQYERLEPLAYKILRNLCIDRSRKKKIILTEISNYAKQMMDQLTPLRMLELEEELQQVQLKISKLSEKQRMIFFLRHIEDYKIPEIANRMNLKINTVEANLSRIRKKLRTEFKK